MINIGIIGAGFWGEKHAEAIKQIPNAKLIAANRSTPKALQEFTQKYNF